MTAEEYERIIDDLRYTMRKAADYLDFDLGKPYLIDERIDRIIRAVQATLRAAAALGGWPHQEEGPREKQQA